MVGHLYRLMKQYSKMVVRSNFFALWMINRGRSLSSDVVNIPALGYFQEETEDPSQMN